MDCEDSKIINMDVVKHKKDFNHATKLTRLLLLPLGIWPMKSKIYQKLVRPIAIILSIFIMLFIIIPMCLFIAFAVKDLKIRLKLIGPFSFGLMSLFKYVVVIYKERQVNECIWYMSRDWQQLRDNNERQIMLKNAKTGWKLIAVCMFFMYCGGMPYITVLPLSKGPVIRGNQSVWPLAYPAHFVFFNPQVKPYYNFVYTLQCTSALVRYTVTCGVYSIVILCIMHICSQVTITRASLNKLVDNFDYKLLAETVKQHRRLLRLAGKLEEIFNKICLFEVCGSSCIICFLGYYLITEYENKDSIALITYSFLLSSFVFNIFILCYVGQILTEKCESIGQAIYMTTWYRLPQKEAKNLITIIQTTRRPVYLTAGKLFTLSILTFSNVIKCAASYLNILRTVIAYSV